MSITPCEYALGIDIGGTNTKVGIVSASGDAAVETFPTGRDTSQLVARIRDAYRRSDANTVSSAGVAVAGFLNSARDRLSYNPNLEWLAGPGFNAHWFELAARTRINGEHETSIKRC